MRRLLLVMLSLASAPTFGGEHNHDDCLGHHWHSFAYYHEMQWQLKAMVLILASYALAKMVMWCKRRAMR